MKQITVSRIILLLSILISISNLSFGQFQGPGVINKTFTIKEVSDNASKFDRSDALVKVQGYIVKQMNADTYAFKDKTGTINVEIDRKLLTNRPFDDKTELILIGEVDHDIFEPLEIEIKEVLFVVSESKDDK
ncbi:MAG: hypothetical protein FD170_1742 [Bacteroidetes bacterium]|nr:MAG: hypothetical protein FD170_1742 [Bacteroidota bacterium]